MLENPLCSFWTQDISEVWAGAEIEPQPESKKNRDLFSYYDNRYRAVASRDGKTPITGEMRRRAVKLEDVNTPNQRFSVWLDPWTNTQWFE